MRSAAAGSLWISADTECKGVEQEMRLDLHPQRLVLRLDQS
jgi:hypothetical protein